MKLTLKNRIIFLSSVMLLGLITLAYVAYGKSKALMVQLEDVSQSQLPAVRNMTLIDMYHDGMKSVVLDSLLTVTDKNYPHFLEINENLKEFQGGFNTSFTELESLPLRRETKEAIANAKPSVEAYIKMAQEISALCSKGFVLAAKAKMPEFDKSFNKLEGDLEALGELIREDANRSRDEGKDVLKKITLIASLCIFFGIVFSVYVIRRLNAQLNEVTGKLQKVVKVMVEEVQELGQVSNSVAVASTQQNSAVHEAVASLAEISSMVSATAESSKSSMQMAHTVTELADQGKNVMEKVVQAMEMIEKSNRELQSIAHSIHEIDQKAAVINDIVFKTQLLSFNASIEAARAGEQGRGFSVVAEEVGSLAQMSGQAARLIQELLADSKQKVDGTLKSIRSRVNEGNQVSEQAMKSFLQISQSVKEIHEALKQNAEATRQQQLGIEQSNLAMKELNQVSQKNLQSSQASKKVSDGIEIENLELKSVVVELEQLVMGKSEVA
jgi:methyl-accepting chemotaxis protein